MSDNKKDLEQSLKRTTLLKAKDVVSRYSIILEPDEKCGFRGTAIELPTVFTKGKTPSLCFQATQESLMVAVAVMLKNGKHPPQPGSPAKRTTQVNIRLNNVEEHALRSRALTLGFRGISDYLRNLALKHIPKNLP